MRIGQYEFRPRPGLTIVALTVLCLFLGLAAWQMNRAAEKQVIQDKWEQRAESSPLELRRIEGELEGMQYRAVRAIGTYQRDRQYLLDNRVRNGRMGFRVITPLELADGGIVLVDRGWVAEASPDVPAEDITPPAGEVRVQGVLAPPPDVGLRLGPPSEPGAEWPRPIQYVDVDQVASELGSSIAPYTLMLDAEEPGAFDQEWEPMTMQPATHYGYAFQWFALAVVLLALFVGLNLKRPAANGDTEETK